MSNLTESARQLFSNEAFTEAVTAVREYHVRKAMECAPSDDRGRAHHLGLAGDTDGIANHISALVAAAKSGDEVAPEGYYADQAKKRWAFLRR